MSADFPAVAKAVLLAAIGRLEFDSACDFCRAGESDDDGGDAEHTDECPFFGFDKTVDVERLRAWAKEDLVREFRRALGEKPSPVAAPPTKMATIDDLLSEARERGYIEGRRRSLINQLAHVLQELSGFGEVPTEAQLIIERQETIAELRSACAEHGIDNAWPDHLHLGDIFSKYVIPHFERERENGDE